MPGKYRPVSAPLPLPGVKGSFGALVDRYCKVYGVTKIETFKRIASETGNSPNTLKGRYATKYDCEWVFSWPEDPTDHKYEYQHEAAPAIVTVAEGYPEVEDLFRFIDMCLEARLCEISEHFDIGRDELPDCHNRHSLIHGRILDSKRHLDLSRINTSSFWASLADSLGEAINNCETCSKYLNAIDEVNDWFSIAGGVRRDLGKLNEDIEKSYVTVERVVYKCHRCGEELSNGRSTCRSCLGGLSEIENNLWENHGAEIIEETWEDEWPPAWSSGTPSTQLATRCQPQSASSRGE